MNGTSRTVNNVPNAAMPGLSRSSRRRQAKKQKLRQDVSVENPTSHTVHSTNPVELRLTRDHKILDDKVDSHMRYNALSQLRVLHLAFYDLSPITFCKTVALLDRFIAKVRVKPQYALCLTATCYYMMSKYEKSKRGVSPDPENLVELFRCGGRAEDLRHMMQIVISKLGEELIDLIGNSCGTLYDWLSVLLSAPVINLETEGLRNRKRRRQRSRHNSDEIDRVSPSTLDGKFTCNSQNCEWNVVSVPIGLVRVMENCLCLAQCSKFRPSCLALAILFDMNNKNADSSNLYNVRKYSESQLRKMAAILDVG